MLRLRSFRVTNYRSVEDSGEVTVEDFRTLVGKNESGKTSILKALHKFNPAAPEPFNGLREFPRRKFHEFDENDTVVQIRFSLSDEELDYLHEIDPRFQEIQGVTVTKSYAGKFTLDFLPALAVPPATKRGLSPLMGELKASIDALTSAAEAGSGSESLQKIVEASTQIGAGISEDQDLSSPPTKKNFEDQIQKLSSLLGSRPSEGQFAPVFAAVQMILNTINWESTLERANKFLLDNIPVFIYFENYAIIDSRIHLPSFVDRLRAGSMTPEDRTAKTLFSLVKLDPERLVSLGKSQGKNAKQIQEGIDERALLVDRASLSLTGLLADLWLQRKNKVDFDVDGDYLRLWVTDNIDKSKIELEQRSKGFQWFLSFYVIFNVESESGHKSAMLLLDEPGLHLHASAQEDLLKVLKNLAESNQLIYTTHSPFMIDMESLSKVSTVIETKEAGTKVSDSLWGTDKEALFPLQAALGYSMSQALFVGRYNLVVEGITDFWILSTISQLFKDSGHTAISDGIVISPAGGAQKAALLAAMLSGQKLKVSVLLDADLEGRNVRNDVVKSRIVRENNVFFVSDATDKPDREMELEDLLPPDMYLKFSSEEYSKELGKNLLPLTILRPGLPIRKSLEAEFERRGFRFSKYRVARRIMQELPKMPFEGLPPLFVENIEKLFTMINRIQPADKQQPEIAVADS